MPSKKAMGKVLCMVLWLIIFNTATAQVLKGRMIDGDSAGALPADQLK